MKIVRKFKVNKTIILLFVVFAIALIVRFFAFRESTYFGYDEAREAFVSQSIYQNWDLKIVGPPTTTPGVYHGPLFWYLLGPLYLIGGGDVYFVSAVFRIINALGVFLVFLVASKLFDRRVGLLAASLYAISFEQTQYALFTVQPTLGIFAWFLIAWGFAILIKNRNSRGLIAVFTGCALATQFNFFLIYTFIVAAIALLVLVKNVWKLPANDWLLATIAALLMMGTFIAGELKYQFQTIRGLLGLLSKGYDLIAPEATRMSVYFENLINVFRYNLINSHEAVVTVVILVIFLGLFKYVKQTAVKFLIMWLLATLLLVPFGMGEALYFNVGIGAGLLIAVSFLFLKLWKKRKIVVISCLLIILWSNLSLIIENNPRGLITRIKPQPYMLLSDELSIIKSIYRKTQGKGFTIRVTGIPFGVQTVWAYLFTQYGLKDYGYLPYFETGNIEGFLGSLPSPQKGTTCLRFLITEPTRGIPINLIEKNIQEEDNFSDLISQEKFGEFVLQIRLAKDPDCHDKKPDNKS